MKTGIQLIKISVEEKYITVFHELIEKIQQGEDVKKLLKTHYITDYEAGFNREGWMHVYLTYEGYQAWLKYEKVRDKNLSETESCKWIIDDEHEYYDTDCGLSYCITDGSLKENHYKYCPGCGNLIDNDE